MKVSSAVSEQPSRAHLLIPLVLGAVFATVLIYASTFPLKWFVAVFLALVGLSMYFLIPDRQKFFLYASVLLMGVGLDVHLFILESVPYSMPVIGLAISAFDIVFFYLFASWLFRLVTDREAKIHFYWHISVPVALIWVICLLSSISSPLPPMIKIAQLWYIFKNWLVFLYFANNIRDRRTLVVIVALFLFLGVIQSSLAITQYLTKQTIGLGLLGERETAYSVMRAGGGTLSRVAGTVGHPNKLAMLFGALLPLNLALFLAPIRKRFKWLLLGSLLLMSAAEILTFSRGGWLSLSVGGFVTLYWCFSKRSASRFLSGFVTVAIVAVTIVTAVTMVEPVRQRLFKDDYGAAYARIPLTKLALSMIRENPLLGVGLGSFTAVAPRYDRTRDAISTYFPAPVHNDLLLIGTEVGLPALVIFLSMLTVVLVLLLSVCRSREDPILSYVAIGFVGAWITWFVHHQVAYGYILLNLSLYFTIGLVQAMKEMDRANKAQPQTEQRTLSNI